MPKTHHQIVEAAENRLLSAMCNFDMENLYLLVHPNLVYTNENGQVFTGIDNLQINNPEILRIRTIDVDEREIAIFNNVAIVNTFEKRTGECRKLNFKTEYRMTRIWKFHNKQWVLIAASVVML